MKYLCLSLILGVSGLFFSSFATPFWMSREPSLSPSLAGIDCPEDKTKPCADDEIRFVSLNREL